MSADTLRQAASLMRERATAAIASLSDNTPEWHSVSALMGDGKTQGDAEHIVGQTPTVALAVAELLDDLAMGVELGLLNYAAEQTALVVATAYLGSGA